MKRKWNKAKIKKKMFKATQGAISLMLCILITPFLTMAGALIELSRYQSATELMQEVVDSSMLSVLAEYDEFLEDRFALFAVSQDVDMTADFNQYLTQNSKILGGAVGVDSTSLNGKFSLATNSGTGSYDVLQSQLLDFSETTVVTEMALENFKLQKLIDELKKITKFSNLTTLADKAKNATSAIKDLVESAEALYNNATDISNKVNSICGSISNISTALSNIYTDVQKDLNFNFSDYNIIVDPDKGVLLKKINPTGDDDDEIDIISHFRDSKYKSYFNTIKSNVQSISDNVNGIKNNINNFSTQLNNFKDAITRTKSAISELSQLSNDYSSSGDDQKEAAGNSTKTMNDVYEDIIEDFENLFNEIGEDFVNSFNDTLDEVVESFKNDVFEALDFGNVNAIPKETLETILDYFKSGQKPSFDGFLDFFLKNNPISQLISKIGDLPGKLKNAAESAVEKMKEQFKEQIIKSLKAIVAAIKNLFGLDGLFKTELNAYLGDDIYNKISPQGEDRGAFEKFLDGIVELIKSIDGLTTDSDWIKDPFGALKNALQSLFGIFDGVTKVLDSIITLVTDYIRKVGDFISDFGNLSNFYDFFLLAGYMIHNLPNRTNYDSDSSLTGFKYTEIPKDSSGFANYGLEGTGIEAIANFIGGALDENGGNKTFIGAEAEYIVSGTRSEIMNQVVTFMQIYILRLLLDLPAVFTDINVTNMAGAAGIFAWIVYLVVMFAEPLCDTVLLVNGGPAYLIKTKCYMTPAGISNLIKALEKCGLNGSIGDALQNEVKNNMQSGDSQQPWSSGGTLELDYEDHLLIVMAVFVRKTQMLSRFADIVEIEATQRYNGSFDMNKAFTCVSCNATVTYYPLISVFEAAGLTTFSIDYEQDRSY